MIRTEQEQPYEPLPLSDKKTDDSSRFTYKDGLPITITTGNHVFPISATQERISKKTFFQEHNASGYPYLIATPQQGDTVQRVWANLKNSVASEVEQMTWGDTYAQMNSELDLLPQLVSPEEAEEIVPTATAIRDDLVFLSHQARQTMIDAFSAVKKETTVVTRHTIQIPDIGAQFQRIRLHTAQATTAKDWEIDKAIAETLIFAHHKVGITLPASLTFVSMATGTLQEETYQYAPQMPTHKNDIQEVFHLLGQAYPNLGIGLLHEISDDIYAVLPSDENENRQLTHGEAMLLDNQLTARHETGHLVDPYHQYATRNQSDGFATAIERKMRLDDLIFSLRHGYDYRSWVSQDTLNDLFSSQPRRSPVVEQYTLSATFFAYLYTHYGENVMMDWYRYISGAAITERLLEGNVVGSLEKALTDNDISLPAEYVVERYLAQVNDEANPATYARKR